MASALVNERRSAPRLAALVGTGLDRARLRPGRTARVINLSAGGALIETDWRLLPGTRVELEVGTAAAPFRITALLLRCHVSLVSRERIRYRGALSFDRHLPFGEPTDPR